MFTPDGTYSAFGVHLHAGPLPRTRRRGAQGAVHDGHVAGDLDGDDPDTATGTQPLCFIEHSKHDMRIGYYNDTYVRTDDGWRLKTRAMTFIRRSGDHDSGRPHAIGRPEAG